MAKALDSSLLQMALDEILKENASPHFKLDSLLLVGGEELYPLKTTRFIIETDYVNKYYDSNLLYCIYPKGDIMNKIAPFKEDLNMRVRLMLLDSEGKVIRDKDYKKGTYPEGSDEEMLAKDGILLDKVYRCYIDDHIPSSINTNDEANSNEAELTNLSEIETIIFRLEEVSIEIFRLMRTGVSSARITAPMDVVRSLLTAHVATPQVDDSELLTGPEVEDGYNTSKSWNVTIPDGLPLAELPDYVQNEQGGLYKDGLGFYITKNHMYIWPLYDVFRLDKAGKTLRIFLSPDKTSGILDRTWRIPEESKDTLELWISSDVDYKDESLGLIQKYGNLVTNVDAESMFEGRVKTIDNTAILRKGKAVARFLKASLLSGRVISGDPKITSNPYILSSHIAMSNGAYVTFQWNHSCPFLITPNMSVELIYDHEGHIRNVTGTVIAFTTLIDSDNDTAISAKYTANTFMTVFVDRHDHILEEWLYEGKNVITTPPVEISTI